MISLDFVIGFSGPFRVSTGHARPGVDSAIDLDNVLPASSLKGMMRATASRLLGLTDGRPDENAIVEAVFGSPRRPSPWHWIDAEPDGGWAAPTPASRIRIGPDHVVQHDMLGTVEQTRTEVARFAVDQRGHIDPSRIELHRVVLAIAARATRSLGADRRRGSGWVHIDCPSVDLDLAAVDMFLRQGATAS